MTEPVVGRGVSQSRAWTVGDKQLDGCIILVARICFSEALTPPAPFLPLPLCPTLPLLPLPLPPAGCQHGVPAPAAVQCPACPARGPALTRPPPCHPLPQVTTDMMAQHLLPAGPDSLALMCGPPAMLEKAVLPGLKALGYKGNLGDREDIVVF